MARLIFTGLSPNAERDDIARAVSLVVQPWTWRNGEGIVRLERAISGRLGGLPVITFSSGRGALAALFEALQFEAGSEILLQAYTCVVVPNAIRWTGYVPVFVDIEGGSLNMDPTDLERRITPKSRAVIVQHTFGRPAEIGRILEIAKRHRLVVIEDCAHVLGVSMNGRPLGTFGDAAFFSFGRDKSISSVFGGCAAVSNPKLVKRLQEIRWRNGRVRFAWIGQQLVHPIVLAVVAKTYAFGIGKVLFFLAKRLHLISLAVSRAERMGQRPRAMSRALPNALAVLAFHQLEKLERLNAHRRMLVSIYRKGLGDTLLRLPPKGKEGELTLLRYVILSERAEEFLRAARARGIYLGDWYRSVVAPSGTEAVAGYVSGSCPVAERAAKETVNLPTGIGVTEADARRIVRVIRECV